MIYFDHSSTTSVHPEVVSIYSRLLSSAYGNPDSLHKLGREVNEKLEQSRKRIASMLGVLPEEIIFTGSGSEANSLALIGYALANRQKGNHILLANSQHSSVMHSADFLRELGFAVEELPIDETGKVSAELVKEKMRKDTILVSLLHVNNEVGAITDLSAAAKAAKSINPACKVHADCVQSFCKIDIPFKDLDLVSVSAHKIHGLKGSGMLIKKKNTVLRPIIQGGQQEQGLRGGTENAPANIVLAKTIRLAKEKQSENYEKVSKLNHHIQNRLKEIEGSHVNSPDDALPYILNVSFDQITSEVLLNALDQKDIYVSAKSTCSSHDTGASQILLNMNKSMKDATHAIRLSFGEENTIEEGDAFIEAVKEIISQYGLSL